MPSVLICDDHRLFAESLGLALEQRGHRVSHAARPAAAVELVLARPADVCLLDRHFPCADGLDAVADLRAAAPAMRIVMLSGSTAPDLATRARSAGVELLAKDGPVEELVGVVEGRPAGPHAPPEDAAARTDGAREPLSARSLTAREREVLRRLVAGQETKALARDLGVTYATARSHIQNVLTKLNVHSKLEAVAYAISHGLVAPGAPRPAGS